MRKLLLHYDTCGYDYDDIIHLIRENKWLGDMNFYLENIVAVEGIHGHEDMFRLSLDFNVNHLRCL